MQRRQPTGQDPKELYRQQYEESKKKGETFYPSTIARDAVVGLVVVAVLFALAIWAPPKLEPMADPTSTTYNPRPEWYFLFFFQFLKLFPGYLEALAAIVIPVVALAILVIIPLIDRSWERRWSKRKQFVAGGVLVVLALAGLEVGGALNAPARPAGEVNVVVQEGRDVYQQVNCSYCHSINGIGGTIGPDLGNIGETLTQEQILGYLQNPHAMVPTTLHPKLLFTTEELQALGTYLSTLGAPVSYSANAPASFTQYCSGCHQLNGQGAAVGPDLTNIGDRRPLSFLQAFISDPGSVLPGSTMPEFKDKLSSEQINDIAGYLFSQKSKTPAPTSLPPTATP
jgi:mono/diheme cytochrome c family protein